jgi:hypothetical protein
MKHENLEVGVFAVGLYARIISFEETVECANGLFEKCLEVLCQGLQD